MRKNIFQKLFLLVTIVYFTGMALQNEAILLICKPLLVTSLLFHFIAATKNHPSTLKIYIIAALVFSIAGDTLLMFVNQNERFFLLGLSAFLLAHIFYIICFHKIKTKEQVAGKWQWSIIVLIYYFFIISFLMPHLGGMKIPVLVYGLVISFMLFTAMLLYDLNDNKTARYLLTGALLFVISDSVLAINKFYRPLAFSGWMIMTTYVLAQWMLVRGLVLYTTKTGKPLVTAN